MKCSPLFLCIESAIPTFKDTRAAVARASWQRARATWIPDQWLDRESVHPDVRRSKNTLWSWWIKLFRIYVLERRQIWYERYSTQKDPSFLSMHSTWVDLLLAFNSSMISVRNIFAAHPPRDFKRFWNLTLAALGTKKQQELQIWIGLGFMSIKRQESRKWLLYQIPRTSCYERDARYFGFRGVIIWRLYLEIKESICKNGNEITPVS